VCAALLGAGGAVLLAGGRERDEASWVVYTSPREGWSAEMPAQPEVDKSTARLFTGIDAPLQVHVVPSFEGGRYGVGVITVPDGVVVEPPAEFLARAADAAESEFGAPLVRQEPTEVAGRPALDYSVETPDGSRVRARLVLDGNRLYAVQAASEEGEPKEADRFIESFTFVAPAVP
jgi:hypothetical protein